MGEPATRDFYYGWLFGMCLMGGLIMFVLVAAHWLDAR